MKIDLNTLLKNNKHENSLTKMIDNPLPDQVMDQKDQEYMTEKFEELARDKVKNLADLLLPEYKDSFYEWYVNICYKDEEELSSLIIDYSPINDWWEEVKDDYEDCLSPLKDYEPTDQEIMSNFGTKWHDGL